MPFTHVRRTIAAVWVFAIGATALLAGVTSSSSSLVLAGCAILPPLVMMRYWNDPGQTMSRSIQRGLR